MDGDSISLNCDLPKKIELLKEHGRAKIGDQRFEPTINLSLAVQKRPEDFFNSTLPIMKMHKDTDLYTNINDNGKKRGVSGREKSPERKDRRSGIHRLAREVFDAIEKSVHNKRADRVDVELANDNYRKELQETLPLISDDIHKSAKKKALLTLIATMKSDSVEELRDSLRLRYFLPERCTKKAMQLLLQSACMVKTPGDTSLVFTVPPYQSYVELCISLGFNNPDEFYEKVKQGLKLAGVKEAKDLLEDQGEGEHGVYDEKEQERLQRIFNDACSEGDDSFGLVATSEKARSEDYENDDASSEEDAYLKKTGRRITTILTNAAGFSLFSFKYTIRYCYKVLGMLYSVQTDSCLPFGRTIPDATWIYIFSLLIDSQDVLCLKEKKEARALREGDVTLFEKITIFDETVNYEMFEKFGGVLKESRDGSAMGLLTFLLRQHQILGRKSAALACLNDERDEIVKAIDKNHQNMLRFEVAAADHNRSVNLKVNSTKELLDSVEGGMYSTTVLRQCILKLTGVNVIKSGCSSLEERKKLINPINVSFGQEMALLYEKYCRPGEALEARATLVSHYEHALQNSTGQFAYLLEVMKIDSADTNNALSYWFGSTERYLGFKRLVEEIKVSIGRGLHTGSKEFRGVTGLVDHRRHSAFAITPIEQLGLSKRITDHQTVEMMLGNMSVLGVPKKKKPRKPDIFDSGATGIGGSGGSGFK